MLFVIAFCILVTVASKLTETRGNIMLQTIEVLGVEFDVYYECEVEHDPYGTGDSPTSYNIEIISIEAGTDTQDLHDLLSKFVIENITEQLINIEAA